jgi:hypothetical protein
MSTLASGDCFMTSKAVAEVDLVLTHGLGPLWMNT